MLQRYLKMSARLTGLRKTAATMLAGSSGNDNGNNGKTSDNINNDQNLDDNNNDTDGNNNDTDGNNKRRGDNGDGGSGGGVGSLERGNPDQMESEEAAAGGGGGGGGEAGTVSGARPSSAGSDDGAISRGGCSILLEQLDLVGRVLDRELSELSEGDLLIISER